MSPLFIRRVTLWKLLTRDEGSKKLFEAFVTKVYTNKKYYDLLFKDCDASLNVSYQVISKVVKEGI